MFALSQLEEAAKEVADEVTRPRPVEDEAVQDIQVMLKSDAHPINIRSLKVKFKLQQCASVWSPLLPPLFQCIIPMFQIVTYCWLWCMPAIDA